MLKINSSYVHYALLLSRKLICFPKAEVLARKL